MKKLVCGIGINDADYVVVVWETVGYVDRKQKQKLVWICPFYRTWVSMLERGYSDKFKAKRPTYEGSVAVEKWHLFSNFRRWMMKQDWEGNQLDKDLLVQGNKVYGPNTCVFISRQVNIFLIDRGASRGECMIGVSWDKNVAKFVAKCCNPFTKKQEYLGLFVSEIDAHQAWLKRKLEHAYELAALQTDARVAEALIDRYTNYN